MDKDKIEMKTTMESAAVAEYLTALAKGFKSGVICVEKGGETLTLIPADIAEVEVEARVKKDKARFSLEVSWRLAPEADDAETLTISDSAPKTAAPCEAGKADPKCDKKDEKKEDNKDEKKDAKDVKKIEAAAPAPAVKPVLPASAAPAGVTVVKPAPAPSPASAPKATPKA
ncbi:amphi-Trp domain-containing protein [Humidesulfovibrio sp.]